MQTRNEDAPLIKSNRSNTEAKRDDDIKEYGVGSVPGLSGIAHIVTPVIGTILGVACFPFTICGGFFTVNEKEEAVILNFGKYTHTVRDPGIHFSNCWGREIVTVSKAKLSIEIPHTKVIDLDGNPVMVSGVVFYHFDDTKKAALDILDRQTFVADQAAAVMKQIVAQFPYEVRDPAQKKKKNKNGDNNTSKIIDEDKYDDSDDDDTPCLKRSSTAITQALVGQLQSQVDVAGAIVDGFKFNEISYAPEIAMSLLKKQQAAAILSSRHTLVDGAVKIASDATKRVNKSGAIVLQPEDQSRLISNILTVVCAEERVQPVISLGSTS